MTLTLELTPAQEKRLREKAAEAGQEPQAYLLTAADIDDAEADKKEIEDAPTGSAYDLFKGRIGLFHGSGANLSENAEQLVAEIIAEKHQQGHL